MPRWAPFSTILLAGLAGCSALLDYPSIERAHVGTPCTSDATCEGLVCGALATGEQVCTNACTDGSECLAGWRCGDAGRCTCLASCVEHCNGRDDDCDGLLDESTCAVGETCVEGECTCDGRSFQVITHAVDILFVVDSGGSMVEEQQALRAGMAGFLRALATGDSDGDGVRERSPVDSIHVGVVTADMGAAAAGVPGCDEHGDDALLSVRGDACGSDPPGVFEFQSTLESPSAREDELICLVDAGTAGCGYEQALEAPLKALSPASPSPLVSPDYLAPVFASGTGHGDGANAGFLRPDSLLVIVVLTDEDDCSTPNAAIFGMDDPRYNGVSLNLRCHDFADQLYPLSRYVDGFRQLRPDPTQIVFAAITGVPAFAGEQRLLATQILALPEMQEVVDERLQDLRPACSGSGSMGVHPARRIVGVAEAIECSGGTSSITSVCQPDYQDAFDYLLDRITSTEANRVCIHDAP